MPHSKPRSSPSVRSERGNPRGSHDVDARMRQLTIPAPPMPPRTTPVGFPQDAGPHDESLIEWWYANAFVKNAQGHEWAIVLSFFRTGFGPQKGHYLIYSLIDLKEKKKRTASILDKTNFTLLRALLTLSQAQQPQLKPLAEAMQQGRLPKPHRLFPEVATLTPSPFAIAMGANRLHQASADARTWHAVIDDPSFAIDLTLTQPSHPAMRVGGEGMTGIKQPQDMFYLSLTHMQAEGTLRIGAKSEAVQGAGWLDRQWGTSWVVQNNGWDWFGLALDDGSELIVYRVRDNKTKAILQASATLLRADGTQVVEPAPRFVSSKPHKDPVTKITYPHHFEITLPTLGLSLRTQALFDHQVIPVLGIGEGIWEGVVTVDGRNAQGKPLRGRGFMELVGYAPNAAP